MLYSVCYLYHVKFSLLHTFMLVVSENTTSIVLNTLLTITFSVSNTVYIALVFQPFSKTFLFQHLLPYTTCLIYTLSFQVMHFGWLHLVMLTLIYFIISIGISFLIYAHIFKNTTRASNKGLMYSGP